MILKKYNFYERFSKIEVICRVLGPQVRTKVEPDLDPFDLDPFTYRGLNKDTDPIFNGLEPPGNWRIEDSFTSLLNPQWFLTGFPWGFEKSMFAGYKSSRIRANWNSYFWGFHVRPLFRGFENPQLCRFMQPYQYFSAIHAIMHGYHFEILGYINPQILPVSYSQISYEFLTWMIKKAHGTNQLPPLH